MERVLDALEASLGQQRSRQRERQNGGEKFHSGGAPVCFRG
jgi:hypothetical protein